MYKPSHLLLLIITIVLTLTACRSSSQSVININLSKKTGIGSPLMFGGNNYGFSTKTISNAHKKAGFNVARYDALINNIVPETTIANYKNDIGDIQNPIKWNWARIDNDLVMLHGSGFKVLLIINYCPLWLTNEVQRNKNNINSVPADWEVYEDIVMKVYQHVQNNVYAIEVWNEPDTGLRFEGSGYTDAISAYLDLYLHTAKPIRALNKTIQIGGPAVADTYNTAFFYALLNDKRLNNLFNFYSYHFYGVQKQGNITRRKAIAASKGRLNFPVFISEWNYSADFNKNPMNSYAPEAVSFIGKTLISQFNETPALSILYCMDDYKKADNFYTMDQQGTFVPKVNVIRLMSVTLGLGIANSTIVKSETTGDVNVLSAVNSTGNIVVCISNDNKYDIAVNSINLKNSTLNGTKNVDVYLVSNNQNGDVPLATRKVTFMDGNATISQLNMPANSVLGIKLR